MDVFLIVSLSLSLFFLRLNEVPPGAGRNSPSMAETTPHHMATEKMFYRISVKLHWQSRGNLSAIDGRCLLTTTGLCLSSQDDRIVYRIVHGHHTCLFGRGSPGPPYYVNIISLRLLIILRQIDFYVMQFQM